jgi:type IV pilus assembly protein PilY1
MRRQAKRTIGIATAVLLYGLVASSSVRAGSDLDVFIAGQSVQPNVLILFDNSGSMADGIPYDSAFAYTGTYTNATIYDRCKTFNSNCSCKTTQTAWKVHTGSCTYTDANDDGQDDRAPSYHKTGNRLNFDAQPNPPKLDVAKSVVDGLLQDPANDQVRFGLMILNGTNLPTDYTSASQTTSYHNDKTILKALVGTDHTALISTVNALTANAGTPLAPRMIAAARYYKHDGYFTGADPVQYLCQRNYVVLMTDGRPQVDGVAFGNCGSGFANPYCGSNASGSFSYIESWLGVPYDKDGDGRDPDPGHFSAPAGCTPNASPDEEPCEYQNGGSDYLDDITKVMLDNDMRTDMDGQQSIVTYTIGFTVGNSLLQRAAAHGGGTYYTANTADELADAFRATLNSIVSETESFVAPVVPVSQTTRTQSGDRLYIALFRPRDGSLRWPGNLKKYQVSTAGDLLDAAGAAATDANGEILTNAKSYWDTTASGSAVSKGGVGEILLNRSTARAIYTNTTQPAYPGNATGIDLTAGTNAFTTANASLTAAMLGAANATERTQIINYVHGIDVYDDDEDSNITEKRGWILGDTVHSVPLVVNYGTNNSAILLGANDGMLHAFDDATGVELWAYVPDDLLSRLKMLTPGASGSHQFFVDSSPKLLTTDAGKKIVVFGFGRGGRSYYALDVTTKTAPKLLWKINNNTNATLGELGQTWSEPAYIRTSSNVDAFLIGGGYDTWYDDPSHVVANSSGAMGRAIYAINALTGEVISKIQPAGMSYAIPSNVAALDFNGDKKVDRAFVGDLGGNMWRIDASLTATKLFSAPSVSGTRLYKIYYAPDVVRDQGFLSVFFGTGDRSNPLETSLYDRIYAIKDDNTSSLTEGNLVDVTTRVTQNGSSAETTLKNDLKLTKGWYIQLNQRPGEKVLASPSAFFSVFFSTFVPLSGVCNAGGDARVYELNYETGGIPDSKVEDPDGAGPSSPPTVSRDLRTIVIGKSIPTELTVTIQREGSSGFVASSGNVDRLPLPELPNNVTPLSWRECSTGIPCRP